MVCFIEEMKMNIAKKLQALGYKEWFGTAQKLVHGNTLIIEYNVFTEKVENYYIQTYIYVNSQKHIADLQEAYNELKRDLEELQK